MSAASGPKIEISQSVFLLDPANIKSNQQLNYNSNILFYSEWSVGTGGTTTFTANGTTAENERYIGTDPYGQQSIIWRTPSNDITSDADGGWNTSLFDVDPTKLYRFSTWIRRTVLGNGSYYLGTNGFNSASTNIGVLNRSNGSTNTNAYFVADAGTVINSTSNWFLLVGHVWPIGSGTGAVHPDTGIYNSSRTKLAAINDFVWQPTTTKSVHRSYLYYSTTSTVQEWSHPRVDLCDGRQVPLSGIFSNTANTVINPLNTALVANTKNQLRVTASKTFAFNNSSHYMALPNSLGYTTQVSVFAWVKIAGIPKGGYHIVCGGQELEISIPTSGELRVGVYTNSRFVSNHGSGLADGKWHYVGFTFNGSTKTAYIDGINVGTQSVTGTLVSSFSNRTVGQYGADTTYALNGEMSSYRVYSTALSNTQVRQNFNALRGRFGI